MGLIEGCLGELRPAVLPGPLARAQSTASVSPFQSSCLYCSVPEILKRSLQAALDLLPALVLSCTVLTQLLVPQAAGFKAAFLASHLQAEERGRREDAEEERKISGRRGQSSQSPNTLSPLASEKKGVI